MDFCRNLDFFKKWLFSKSGFFSGNGFIPGMAFFLEIQICDEIRLILLKYLLETTLLIKIPF